MIPGFGARRGEALRQADRLRKLPGAPAVQIVVADGANVADARNNALNEAAGDYIAWVDADDDVTNDYFAALIQALDKNPDAVVIDYSIERAGDVKDAIYHHQVVDSSRLLGDLLQDEVAGYMWAKCIHRRFWQDVRFDRNLRMLEDFTTLPKVMERVHILAYIRHPIYRYRLNEASLMHRETEEDNRRNIEIALYRAHYWRGTDYYHDALCGAASMIYGYLEKRLLAGKKPYAEPYARRLRRWMMYSFPRLFFGRLSWRRRLKFFIAVTGCWFIQLLSWRRVAKA